MSAGLALGLLASLAWGVVDVTAALAGRRLGSLRVLLGTQLASLATLAVITVIVGAAATTDAVTGVLAGLPLGVGAAAAYLCYFTALRLGPLTVVSPVIIAYGGLTVLLSVLFRGETLLPAQVLATVLATLGVVLASVVFEGGSLRGARIVGLGVVFALATMVLFSVVTVGLAAPIEDHGWLPVITGSRLANTGVAFLLVLVVGRSSSARLDVLTAPAQPLDRTSLGLVIVAGVFDITAFAALAVGLEVAPTWLVGLASSFGPVIVVGYAVWRLGERPRATQWLGIVLLVVGVVVLAVAG